MPTVDYGMRVAALYDVEGNIPALEAVLAELEMLHPDAIVFGGDLFCGGQPVEVVDRARSLSTARFLLGNVDRLDDPNVAYQVALLRQDQRDFVAAFRRSSLSETCSTVTAHRAASTRLSPCSRPTTCSARCSRESTRGRSSSGTPTHNSTGESASTGSSMPEAWEQHGRRSRARIGHCSITAISNFGGASTTLRQRFGCYHQMTPTGKCGRSGFRARTTPTPSPDESRRGVEGNDYCRHRPNVVVFGHRLPSGIFSVPCPLPRTGEYGAINAQ